MNKKSSKILKTSKTKNLKKKMILQINYSYKEYWFVEYCGKIYGIAVL